jgi:hypothetical protein
VLAPDFPGWLAPLHFNPNRWFEFVSFTCTLTASWVLAAALTGGLSYAASRGVPEALRAASWAWLVSMPIAAAQLVLVTAAESRALVGTEDFASALPLAAQVGGVGAVGPSASLHLAGSYCRPGGDGDLRTGRW